VRIARLPGKLNAMPSDDLISALNAALAADPSNADVRRLLAATLADHGRPDEALAHATTLLATRPDGAAAIAIAERSCRALGHDDRADGYARLLGALGPTAPPAPPAPTVPTAGVPDPPSADRLIPLPSEGASIPDNVDDLISQWNDSGEPSPAEPDIGELTTSTITLAHVGGLADVKARLDRSLFAPLRNPELAQAFGAHVRGGIVLYGPPGCGKTYLARAVAGELGARFYSVGISDVLDMWIGSSERNVRSIFEVARGHAPCVLFLDEIDALGQRRTNLRTSPGMRNVVNQLLTELDGVDGNNDGVFLLAATNHPWDIDSALLRPGRLGHLVLVTPPDLDARAHILWSHLADRPRAEHLDVWAVAKRTDGFSGADLREACERAVESAMAESLAGGSIVPIDTGRLQDAASTVRPSIGAWVDTARNVATFSNTDGQYDDLVTWLRKR